MSAGVTPADFYALDNIPMFFDFEEYKRVGCGLMRTGLRELTGTVEEDYSCVCSRGFEEIAPDPVTFFFANRRKECFCVAGSDKYGHQVILELILKRERGLTFWRHLDLGSLLSPFLRLSAPFDAHSTI